MAKKSNKKVKNKTKAPNSKDELKLVNPDEQIGFVDIEGAIDEAMKPYLDREFTPEEVKILEDYKKLHHGKILKRVEDYKSEKKYLEDNKKEIDEAAKKKQEEEEVQRKEFQEKQEEAFAKISKEKADYVKIVSDHIDSIEPSLLADFEKRLTRTKYKVFYNPSFIIDQHGQMTYEIKVTYFSKIGKYIGHVERSNTGYISTPIQPILDFNNLQDESKKNLEKFDKLLEEGISQAIEGLQKRRK